MQHSNFEPKWFVVFVFFLTGIFIGGLAIFAWLFNDGGAFSLSKIHPQKSNYTYINPLLAVDTKEKKQFLQDSVLEEKINNLFIDSKKQGDITEASLYFRDLEAGRWASIQEELSFSPGIFFKIPIMIAYLQGAQGDPGELLKEIVYKSKEQDKEKNRTLEDGKKYTVEKIIQGMLNDDDSDAAEVLFDNINTKLLDEIYSDLGIRFKKNKNEDEFITIKDDALLYRMLYNATYLDRDMSEKALEMLSNASESYGISAGLPGDISVARKYGERKIVYGGTEKIQGHDCGIVYYPEHPFILCAMVVGKDTDKIGEILRQVGIFAYQDMRRTYDLVKK